MSTKMKSNEIGGEVFGYVAVIDILGFTNLVSKLEHKEISSKLRDFIMATQSSLSSRQFIANLEQSTFSANLDFAKIYSIHISDSLILWTENASIESFQNMVRALRLLLDDVLIRFHIPIRGALTVGDLSYYVALTTEKVFSGMVWGKPIVEAYLLEQAQEWFGCIVSDECIDYYKKISKQTHEEAMFFNRMISKYDVPLKQKNIIEENIFKIEYVTKSMHVINWKPSADELIDYRKRVQKIFDINNDQEESVIKKYNNTLAFLDSSYIPSNSAHYWYL